MRPVLSTTTYPQFTKFIFLVPVGWFSVETINADLVSIKCLWEEKNGWKRNSSGTRQRPGFLWCILSKYSYYSSETLDNKHALSAHTDLGAEQCSRLFVSVVTSLCELPFTVIRRNGRQVRACNCVREHLFSFLFAQKGNFVRQENVCLWAVSGSSGLSSDWTLAPFGCTPCCYWTMACNIKISILAPLQLNKRSHVAPVPNITTTGSSFPVFIFIFFYCIYLWWSDWARQFTPTWNCLARDVDVKKSSTHRARMSEHVSTFL